MVFLGIRAVFSFAVCLGIILLVALVRMLEKCELTRSPSREVAAMNVDSVQRAIIALRLIFWGGLLCIFDVTIGHTVNGRGFKFDFLNDALGAIMIAVGVFQLGAIQVHNRYGTVMTWNHQEPIVSAGSHRGWVLGGSRS